MSNIILENTKQHIDESSRPEPDGNASHEDRVHASISSSLKATEGRGWLHWHQQGTSKQERRLICKLDWFFLSYGCLCLFNKNLDQNNISNAYVSGMKEELGFGKGNELSWMTTYFLVGYIFGAPISNLILTIAPPRIVLPSFMLAWSIFVLFLFKCNTAAEFYALRFCIGFFESSAIPGIHYVLGSWYRKSELATRSSFFIMSGVLGQMFSGYLQSALYVRMEGRGGLSAWRWLFIFDFILAIPIVVYGFFFFPDTPHTTKAFYLNQWERNRAKERIDEEGRTPAERMDMSAIKRVAFSWQLWTFSIGWAFWTLTCGTYMMTFFQLWLKDEKTYSVVQINNIPTVIGAVSFCFMFGTGIVSDKIGKRGPVCLVVGLLLILCFIILTIWDVPRGLKMTAFFLSGCYGCFSPLLAGWANSVCGGDEQLRAFTLAFMSSFGQAVVIPFHQKQFPSSEAPTYERTHGYASALAFVAALVFWTGIAIPIIEKRAPCWFKSVMRP